MTEDRGEIQEYASNGVVEHEDVVTPWTVTSANDSGIDYDKLIGE